MPKGPFAEKVGFVLCRVVVPLWILMGVVFKLLSGTPSTLPTNFVDAARAIEFDLGVLLYTLIGLEIFAIAVMMLFARFARPMAIFMLASFCVILIGEIIAQADSCGCFGGKVAVQPWQMLVADGVLLAGVILFRPSMPESAMRFGRAAPIAVGLLIASLIVSFGAGALLHKEIVQEPEDFDETVDDDPTRNPNPRALPGWWVTERLDQWAGTPWRDLEIFQYMRRWPAGLDEGKTYVVFYSRTCNHCEDMFNQDFTRITDVPIVAIEIPHDSRTLRGPDPWPMPELPENVSHMQMPLGPDWIISAPLVLRIEDGIVTCAQEGDHRTCMELPGG